MYQKLLDLFIRHYRHKNLKTMVLDIHRPIQTIAKEPTRVTIICRSPDVRISEEDFADSGAAVEDCCERLLFKFFEMGLLKELSPIRERRAIKDLVARLEAYRNELPAISASGTIESFHAAAPMPAEIVFIDVKTILTWIAELTNEPKADGKD